MMISIIVPIYNVSTYVTGCLKSIVSQSYKGSLECIVVDDCGTDDSMLITNDFIDNYHGPIVFKVVHHNKNRGLSAARNSGLSVAKGEYVFFLDSDDELAPDCIDKLASPLKEELYDIVIGNIQTIGDDKLHDFLKLKLSDGTTLYGKSIQHTYRYKWYMMAQNKLYRMDFLKANNLSFKEGLIHEDELWSLQVSCLAKNVRVVGDFTYRYYIRQGSITAKSTNIRKANAMMTVVLEGRNFLLERGIFSPSAYFIIQDLINDILIAYLTSKEEFIKTYCYLRQVTTFPLHYRLLSSGFNIRRQLRNVYYLIPSKIAAVILYNRMKKRSLEYCNG